ncbi:unnamed protein product [Closterium sp. NIES-53]
MCCFYYTSRCEKRLSTGVGCWPCPYLGGADFVVGYAGSVADQLYRRPTSTVVDDEGSSTWEGRRLRRAPTQGSRPGEVDLGGRRPGGTGLRSMVDLEVVDLQCSRLGGQLVAVVELRGRRARGAALGRRGCPVNQVTRATGIYGGARQSPRWFWRRRPREWYPEVNVADQAQSVARGRPGVCVVHATGHITQTICELGALLSCLCNAVQPPYYSVGTPSTCNVGKPLFCSDGTVRTLQCWNVVDLAALEVDLPSC